MNTLVEPTAYSIDVAVPSEVPPIVQGMLDRGADIKDRDNEDRTPLHVAVQHNRYNYADELIYRGADIMVITLLFQ